MLKNTETDTKEAAQAALRERESTLRAITSSARDAIIVIDNSGNVTFWNEAAYQILGYAPEEVLGKNLHSVIVPEIFMDKHNEAFPHFQTSGEGAAVGNTLELIALKKDKTEIPVELSLSAVILNNKWCAIGILRDITKRKQAENALIAAKEKAEESERLKASFLANMSHELRTPMVGILGFTELLGNFITDESQRSMLEKISTSGNRLLETLNLILDLSRIEAGKLEPENYEFDLNEAIKNLIILFENEALKKKLYVNFENDGKALSVVLDERIVRDVIINLLNNAIKFTKKGGVTIRTETAPGISGKSAIITVEDTGIGIPADKLETIFEEFRQVSEGHNRSFEGSGLGLTITKNFVEKLNGSINVVSEPGKGTVFTVTLPDSVSETVLSSKPAENNPEIYSAEKSNEKLNEESNEEFKKKYSVLLVENDEGAIIIVNAFLTGSFSIDTARSGYEALELVKQRTYHAILMDINLGSGMSGIDTLKEIRQIENRKNIPIIALTAFSMTGDREEFLSNGCDGYIPKPFRKQNLIDTINDVINRFSAYS
ncbi:MAG: ATP-binding protein [Ignavibacteriae bacterium]|nr:ATP-binding protein [Ignavibacteriota bacterium]